MAIVDLVMPKMGESIMEATILKWHKQPGDVVEMDETVLEIATDKVDSDVPSTAAGKVTELLFKEDDVVPVGTVIARIETEGGDSGQATLTTTTPVETAKPATTASQAPSATTTSNNIPANRFYSPLVLNIASKEGIGMAELERIPGTGNEGRVTKKDILSYVANRGNAPATSSAPQQQTPAQQTPVQSAPTSTQPSIS